MDWFDNFHFIRPLWFIALLPLFWIAYCLWKQQQHGTGLEKCISQDLLQHLALGNKEGKSLNSILALTIIWSIVVTTLAGPAWEKRPQPLFKSESAVIIALDLSPSMRAEDVKPSRIIRAHLKIQDFLSQRRDGLTALIVYAGEAHVVTPFTDDTRTIINLLPTLKPGILPLPGSNTEMAIEIAKELIQTSALPKASLLLITDNVDPDALPTIEQGLSNNIDLVIMGIGTDSGAPIPNKGDFLKDKNDSVIIAKRNSDVMQTLATQTGGYYLPLQSDGSDIDFFNQHIKQSFTTGKKLNEQERNSDIWYEFGPTLLVLLLPFIALFFRKGWLLSISFISITLSSSLIPQHAHASWFDSLWKNKDQQGLESWEKNDYKSASQQFNNPQWQGSAHYKNGDYTEALKFFEKDSTAIGDYNRGNALAQLKRYDDAITAYNDSLKKDPELEQAKNNKKVIEDLKKQQEEQQNNQKNDSNKENSNKSRDEQNQQSNGNEKIDSDSGQPNQDTGDSQSSNSNEQENLNNEDNQPQQENRELDEEQTQEESNQDDLETEQIAGATENLSAEEQQALQQWLRKVPDDPSGLLKRKFEYEFLKRRKLYQQGEWELPENNAHKRY